MASRRYRGKNTLNGNIGHVNARLNVVEKMAAPKRLQEGAITTNYLADNAVTSATIAPGSVGSAAIAESSITSPLLATNAVTSTKILDGAITDGKINASGISGNKITSGKVDANYIGNLPASIITSGTIDAARLPATSSDWADITNKPTTFPPETHQHAASDITSGTFDSDRIAAGAIWGTQNTGGATSKIQGNSIGQGDIGPDSIGGSELQDDSVAHAHILNGAVHGSLYADTGGTRSNIAGNSIGQGSIGPDAIGPSELREVDSFTMANITFTGTMFQDTSTRISTTGAMQPVTSGGAGTTLYQSSSGTVILRGTSSRRYKLFEEPIDTGLGILNLQPKTWIDKAEYESNDNSTDGLKRYVGFMAEDLDDAGFGIFVHHNPDGSAESIDYGKLVAAVVPVLKHLTAEVASLKQALSDLGHEV